MRTLRFYRNLNRLISHSKREIKLDVSKTQLLRLYTWTEQKAIKHKSSKSVSLAKCPHYVYRMVIF